MTGRSPRRRTVDEVSAPYANYLVRVPPSGSGVCPVCHSDCGDYPTCWACQEARRVLGAESVADIVAVLSMAPKNEQLARELASYKHANVPAGVRERMSIGLAAVLWKWLGLHQRCIGGEIGVDRFDVITTVPSTSGRIEHPLPHLVSGVVVGSDRRYRDLLVRARVDLDQRAQASDRFRATTDLTGATVLVIDDVWTTGAHAQSAAAALKVAGASGVAVLAIGRWLNPEYGDSATWLAHHRKPRWDWEQCCLESHPPW